MIKFLVSLIIMGAAGFWFYQNWETFGFDSEPEKTGVTKEQQKLNRQKRNPYFD